MQLRWRWMWVRAVLHGFQLCEYACGLLRVVCRVGYLLRVWRRLLLLGFRNILHAVSRRHSIGSCVVIMHNLRRGYIQRCSRLNIVCCLSDAVIMSVRVRVEL